MYARRLIYLTSQQLTVFHWRAGVLRQESSFDASEDGKLRFLSHLAANPKSIFTILANVADESFHIATIPFLRGADRRSIITRKLEQQFFDATLTTAISLGHEKSQRKDERIMLAALTNNQSFAPWLSALASACAALAGVYSLPLLGPLLTRKLGIRDERCLLLTIQDQTIRQSYLRKGELHFSRLTPLQDNNAASVAQIFASEAHKLQQYLVSQRLLGREQLITAYLLVHADIRDAVERHCVSTETLAFAILDIDDCTQHCRLKTRPEDTNAELLFLHLLATDPPSTQFASDSQRHDYHLCLVRSALRIAGSAALIAAVLWSGKQFHDAHRLNQDVEIVERETASARQRYDEIVKTFPPIPTNSETLHQVINRYRELQQRSGSPDYLWGQISRALPNDASLELDRIEWRVDAVVAAPNAAGMTGQAKEASSIDSEVAVVQGSLQLGSDSRPREVLAVFNRLLEALRRNPRLQVEVQQQPFDVDSRKPFKGGGAALADAQPRSFKLQIRRTIGS